MGNQCTIPRLYFQQLSHSWETQHLLHPKACQQQTTSQCVCVFILVYECVHVFVCLRHRAERDWDACLSICICCDVPENIHDVCERSRAVPLGVHIPCVMLTMSSHISLQPTWQRSWLELKEQRRFKWKSRELCNFDFRPPELHLGTFVAWKVWKASKPEEINRFYKYHWH